MMMKKSMSKILGGMGLRNSVYGVKMRKRNVLKALNRSGRTVFSQLTSPWGKEKMNEQNSFGDNKRLTWHQKQMMSDGWLEELMELIPYDGDESYHYVLDILGINTNVAFSNN